MWADTAFVDWDDCVWQNWTDCEWDKFYIGYQDAKERTPRQFYESYVRNSPIEGQRTTRGGRPGKAIEYEWKWLRYLDNVRWTATIGQWFDNRWITFGIGWAAYFDDSDWEGWVGSRTQFVANNWVFDIEPGYHTGRIRPIGSWETGYRPSKIRITYTGNSSQVMYWGMYDTDGVNIVSAEYFTTSPQEIDIDFGSLDLNQLYMTWESGDNESVDINVSNIEFAIATIDISVLGSWAKDLRPEKFRMKFDNATAGVSLKDGNGTEIYAATNYSSEDEVYLDFAGADIDRLVVTGSGDITDIEFLVSIDKRAYRRSGRKQLPGSLSNVRRPYLEG